MKKKTLLLALITSFTLQTKIYSSDDRAGWPSLPFHVSIDPSEPFKFKMGGCVKLFKFSPADKICLDLFEAGVPEDNAHFLAYMLGGQTVDKDTILIVCNTVIRDKILNDKKALNDDDNWFAHGAIEVECLNLRERILFGLSKSIIKREE